MSEQQNSNQHQ